MPNEYYSEMFAGVPRGLALAGQIEDSLKRVEAGFDKIPPERTVKEGRITAFVATGGPLNYTVEIGHNPPGYEDGMSFNVRFPVANEGGPTVDLLLPNGTRLGEKHLRDVNGQRLSAGHIAAHSRANIFYVAEGNGYWILGAGGARGVAGPPGPPDGEFYIIHDTREMGFREAGGTPIHNFGAIAPLFRGDYDGATAYKFLHTVRVAGRLYVHFGLDETTGTTVTDTTVWQELIAGVGTAAFVDTGTDGGNVPVLDSNGKLPPAVIPGGAAAPVGAMLDFAGADAPSGWLVCDGSTVSRTTYAALFAVIGTIWGAGDGTNTFGLPDFRRRVAVGSGGTATGELGNAVGDTGGDETATAPLPAHTHGAGSLAAPAHTHGRGSLSVSSGGSHTHGRGSLSAASAGSHAHTQRAQDSDTPDEFGDGGGSVDANLFTEYGDGGNHNTGSTASAGSHGHTISGSTASAGSHSHTISGSTASGGGGSVTGSTASAGPGGSHNNIQPSAVVLKIIKT